MADPTLRIFISYSRTDSDFVDKLQADLQARNFDAWVDRRRLEGGHDWAQTIQAALDRCQVVLVVLSPNALLSDWVRREYSYAQDNGKRVIPLRYHDVAKIPLRLSELQWVDFTAQHDQGMRDLLVALTPLAALPAPPPPPETPTIPETPTPLDSAAPSDLVEIRPAPPQPNPNIHALYRAGLAASVDGDLERAAILWGQALEQDPDFEGGLLRQQMDALQRNLQPIRIGRLRDRARAAIQDQDWRQAAGAWRALLDLAPDDPQAQTGLRDALRRRAEKAQIDGQWGEEIGAYEALLRLEPDDERAKTFLPIAEQNLQWEYKYRSASDFLQAGSPAAARAELELLWTQAPYYGDPAHIASAASATVPPTYHEVDIARRQSEQAALETQRQQELRATRLTMLRARAEEKRQTGAWIDELAAWKEILELEPDDSQAQERIPIAEWNQRAEATYQGIVRDVDLGLTQTTPDRLKDLWAQTPYYGDPAGIAPKLGLKAPPTYEELKQTDPDQIKRNTEAELKRAHEEAEQVQRAARAAEQRAAFKASAGRRAYFIKYTISATPRALFFTSMSLLVSIGVYTGMYVLWTSHGNGPQIPNCASCSQPANWAAFVGSATALVAGILFYGIALRKVHSVASFALITLLAEAIVVITVTNQPPHPTTPDQVHAQFIAGLVIGVWMAVTYLGVAFAYIPGVGDEFRLWPFLTMYALFGLIIWLIIAGLGSFFHWGVRLGYGWEYGVFGGLLLCLLTAIGLFVPFVVLVRPMQRHYPEDNI